MVLLWLCESQTHTFLVYNKQFAVQDYYFHLDIHGLGGIFRINIHPAFSANQQQTTVAG